MALLVILLHMVFSSMVRPTQQIAIFTEIFPSRDNSTGKNRAAWE